LFLYFFVLINISKLISLAPRGRPAVLAFRSEAATTGEKDIKQQLDMQQLQEALKQIQTERDVRLIFIIINLFIYYLPFGQRRTFRLRILVKKQIDAPGEGGLARGDHRSAQDRPGGGQTYVVAIFHPQLLVLLLLTDGVLRCV
jgi:hypothetical protein